MISSPANERLKNLRSLLRDPADWPVFAVEGVRALEEIARAGVKPESVFYSARLEATPRGLTLLQSLTQRGAEAVQVSESVLEKISAAETSQGAVAVVPKIQWTFEEMAATSHPIFLFEGLSDPGNLGTLVRIADAFDLGGIVLDTGSVSPYNPKAVRAAAGSLFRAPVLPLPIGEALAFLETEDYTVVRAEPRGGVPLRSFPERGRVAVLFGGEAHGISAQWTSRIPKTLRIEMPGAVESLNVAVAAGIVAHHLSA